MNQDNQGRQLFDATCAKCQQPTQVPFEPSGNKPVYCRNCFQEVRGERRGGNGGGASSFGASRGPRQMFDAVCANCGNKTQVPFQPTEGRPVYCRDCFRTQRR